MKYKEFKPSNVAISNRTTIYIFTVLLIIFGIIQYNATPKERFPEIIFPYFMIGTIHPGTAPADVENLITRPIEKQLEGIKPTHIRSTRRIVEENFIPDPNPITIEDLKNNE